MSESADSTGDARRPQASIDRMRRFAIKPKRKLGQNFLVDNNILDLIARGAELGADDVVLEVGGGLGVLSEHLARHAVHVHVVEIDPRLEPPLREALAAHPNSTLHLVDVLALDFAALSPRPTKLVANLPYNVAATALIKAFDELPELALACVMTQREVADRIAAEPGGKLYGTTSVLVQLRCAKPVKRRLSRRIFLPVPNVDSSLVVLLRDRPNPSQDVTDLVHAAFAHRRKPLANSVALARGGGAPERDRVRAALAAAGIDPQVRAERLTATQFGELAAALTAAQAQ